MPTGSRAYVVRDAEAGATEVTRMYPYTLKGLTEALDEARFLSMSGPAQVLVLLADGRGTVIRKYEKGREIPVT